MHFDGSLDWLQVVTVIHNPAMKNHTHIITYICRNNIGTNFQNGTLALLAQGLKVFVFCNIAKFCLQTFCNMLCSHQQYKRIPFVHSLATRVYHEPRSLPFSTLQHNYSEQLRKINMQNSHTP